MKYNFDEIIDRRHAKYSYSMKWSEHPSIKKKLNVDEINDDTIALFTADMDFKCAPPIINALKGVAEHGVYGYSLPPVSGEYHNAVINWFKRRHNWLINQDEIVYVDGTVEAMKQIILAFTDPGDGVIIQRPVYGPFTRVIAQTKREVVNNQLIEEINGYYTMDFKDLEEKCKNPKNKVLMFCSPHNPVGRIWTDNELLEVARICRENHVIIAADEIHGDLIRKEQVFRPLALLSDDSNIITATAVNKAFNLAGLHCTNLVIKDHRLRDRFLESYGFNLPSPFTIAAVIAAYNEGEDWLNALNSYLDANIDWLLKFLKERMPKVKCRRPDGTYIVWMDFRGYGLTPDKIHDKIYKKANVLLEGGHLFDPDHGGGFERVCVSSPFSMLKEAFERIAKEFDGL